MEVEVLSLPSTKKFKKQDDPASTFNFDSLSTGRWQVLQTMNKLPLFISSLREKAYLLARKVPIDQIQQWATQFFPSASSSRDLLVLRPGSAKGEWQLWKMPSKKLNIEKEEIAEPVLLKAEAPSSSFSQKGNLVVGVPTRDLIVYPLWVASESNLEELVALELSTRNLLRRGMAEGLKIIPLCYQEGRTLVVALASTTTPANANAPYLEKATYFEAAARLLGAQGAELFLWRELGEVCFGFLRENQLVWFSGSGETEVNRPLLGLIKRMALQFQAEAVLEKMPQSICLLGSFSEKEERRLKGSFEEILEDQENNETLFKPTEETTELVISEDEVERVLPVDHPTDHLSQTVIVEEETQKNLLNPFLLFTVELQQKAIPAPTLPKPLLDLPSPQACQVRLLEEKKARIKKTALLAFLVYVFFLFLGGANLLLKEGILHHLTRQLAKEQPAIEKATQTILTWHEFRGAFDPRVYVLDLLAVIASKIKGEKIRLISLAGADGKLHIAGEASDVSQAYHFMESIKAAPELQEYQWVSDQPKLAGKNNVRFEIEGSLPNAKTSPE